MALTKSQPTERIAIVAVAGLFPCSPDLEQFWQTIASAVDATSEPPAGRWLLDPAVAFDPHVGAPDKVCATRGGFIEPLKVEPGGLEIEPAALEPLDPLFHLALHVARRAWSDARTEGLDRGRVGVILGNLILPTETTSLLSRQVLGRTFAEQLGVAPDEDIPNAPWNAFPAGLPAGLIARDLGLGGGTYTLDAACASSLYAVKLAADELLAGRADAMLTGGISRPDSLYTQMGFSQLRALAPGGRPRPFDANGDGLIVGEGAGIFVLKRLSDALHDGDAIHGVIAGAGLSNDVDGGLLAPSSEGQLRAMRAAYEQSGWDPRDVELIECHATGTPVGDGIELASLRALWGSEGWQPGQCVIGSVKSNIGHALTAAGAAGLLKVLLAMRHRTLPPTANFERPCANLEDESGPFRVLTEAKPWNASADRPRRAAVSGFGFGGINAHLLIEEWDPSLGTTVCATKRADDVPIAIVGMSAQLGPFAGLRAVQERALGGGDLVEPAAPRNWWGIERTRWFEEAGERPHGYFLNEVTLPLDRFRIPPKELEEMLPQQSLMLRVAGEAIVDAGWDERPRPRVGTLIGIGLDLNTTNFQLRWWARKRAPEWNRELGLNLAGDSLDAWTESLCDALGPALTANRTMGALGGLIASRIAREFRIGGPSFTVSSDETSGTRALAIAARLLGSGELDEAVVGAVDLPGDPRTALAFRELDKAQATNRESPTLGEGAVAFVLKRLDDAERDGDRVYAVLAGFGEGNGGAAQTLKHANVNISALGYLDVVDADPAAAAALHPQRTCALASAQADFGRAGAAAGLAAVGKAALCLYQQIVPPLRQAPPSAATNSSAFVPREPQYWLRDRDDGPRHALVSAQSLDGNRHHVVLREFESAAGPSTIERTQPLGTRRAALFAVEADECGALVEALRNLESLATEQRDAPIEALARRWWASRPNDARRRFAVALVAENADSLRSQLSAARAGVVEGRNSAPATATRGPYFSPSLFPAGEAREPLGEGRRIAFVYPGLGSLHAGMGRGLAVQWPEVLRRQDAENGKLRSQLAPGAFWNADLPASFADHCAPILGQVAVGALVTDLLQTFGIKPDATIGYSLGETTALVATRAWTQRDEMLWRLYASPLFRTELAGPCDAAARAWGLAKGQRADWLAGLVPCSPATVDAALEGRKRVYRLIVNAPDECVIGGERAAVLRLVDDLGCRLFPLPLVSTVHCEIARIVAREYRELHLLETTAPAGVRVYSGAWGRAYRPDQTTAANAILAHATEGIDFPAVIERAYADGLRVFVEVGPGSSCSRLVDAILGDRPHLARSACPGGQDEVVALFDLLARLIAERVHVDLSSAYGRDTRVDAHRSTADASPRRGVTIPAGGRPMTAPPRPAPPHRADETRNVRPAPPPVEIPPIPTEAPVPAPSIRFPALDPSGLPHGILASTSAKTDAHAVYLSVAGRIAQSMANQLNFQMALVDALMNDAPVQPAWDRMPRFTAPSPALDRDQCLEFAVGSIGAVLGPEFAEVDAFPTRVRLPDEPLMLVDRILSIEGESRSMTHGRVVTEHDVLPGAWYLDGGRIPPCIAIESGQADLFLSGYLGIDFITRGLAVYRLLDAAVTFYRGLPGPGSVIRYDIYIDRFFRQGETHLFRFRFEAEVDGQPLMSMRDGCAGFFTAAELAAGKGIVAASLDRRPQRGTLPADWTPLVEMRHESYTDVQVEALRHGDLPGAFGPLFEGLPLRAPAPLPGGRMTLVDRVLSLEPNGGRYGLGLIRAEADIHPGDWFMVCHFVDDRVMPGTLMYECCLHTLRIYLTRLGWVGEADEVAWEPLPGVATRLRCRGQVTESTRKVVYEIAVKELGYGPEPFAIVDSLMFADGRPIVEIANMSLRLTGQSRTGLQRLWAGRASEPRPPLYTREQILAFAIGKPSEAFGPAFRVFDEDRFIARLPGPPYAFLDRVTALSAEPLRMVAGGTVETEYDITPEEWYFAADRQPRMPFAVLLEIALQPCGWMAAYMGSALTSDEPLHFRNLGGKAELLAPVTPASGTLTVAVKVTRVAHSAGMIIQHFDFDVRDRNGSVYRGDTYFGYFRPEALAHQVGIREASPYAIDAAEQARARAFAYPTNAPFPDDRWRMIERIDAFVVDGGPAGLGVIEGSKAVNPDDWFFKAHFYQDPVVPGSLGLESFLQLLKVVAGHRWGVTPDSVFETPVLSAAHRWIYRGQVIPTCERVKVQAVVSHVDDARCLLRADGYLSVDGRIIYQMNDFTLALR